MSVVTKATLRRALWIALAALVCSIVTVSLPPVQTRVARAVLSRLDGVEVDLDYLAAGLGGVTVTGLRVDAAGLAARVESVDVDIAFWSSLARLGLDVEQVKIRGVDLRATPVPDEKTVVASAPREPFAGLARLARLPARIRV